LRAFRFSASICCLLLEFDFAALPCDLMPFCQVAPLKPWMCTTVPQGRGPQLSSAWRASPLQPHPLVHYR
jgi:hypothetical protein